jgi:translation initiation factor 2D
MSSLWESSSKPKIQAFQPPLPISPLSPNPNQTVETEAGPSRPRSNSTSAGTTKEREEGIIPSLEDLDISEPQIPKQNLSSSEISTLLSLSLLQSLQSPPSLPIPASLLYSAHVLPNRPAYIPVGNRDEVVIAKSDWKKLGKWMKEVSKDGLIKIKETKGEVIVISYVPPCLLYLLVSPMRWREILISGSTPNTHQSRTTVLTRQSQKKKQKHPRKQREKLVPKRVKAVQVDQGE